MMDIEIIPEGFRKRYTLFSVLSENSEGETLMINNKIGRYYVAKCYNKGSYKFNNHNTKGLTRILNMNAISIYETFENENMIMDIRTYVDGSSLKDINFAYELDQARNIIIQVCEVIEYLHSKNIVHGNLKPSNVIIDGDGKGTLVDFDTTKQKSKQDDIHDFGIIMHYILTAEDDLNIKSDTVIDPIIDKCLSGEYKSIKEVKKALIKTEENLFLSKGTLIGIGLIILVGIISYLYKTFIKR